MKTGTRVDRHGLIGNDGASLDFCRQSQSELQDGDDFLSSTAIYLRSVGLSQLQKELQSTKWTRDKETRGHGDRDSGCLSSTLILL